jgi:AcrR family transcriptional regulator
MTTDDATSDLNAVIDLLWSPAPTPKRGPRRGLTLTDIATAGITRADSDGLTAVTMQRVAEALGVTKMALYRYVPGKTELVALMTDVALGEPENPDPTTDWRTALHAWAHAMINRFVRHPWTLETTTGVRAMGPNEIAWLEQALTALDGTGLDGSEKLDVAATLAGHARAIAQQATPDTSAEKGLEAVFALVLRDHAAQFPALTAALDSVAANGGQDQAFDFGLNRILDGIALLVGSRS